MIKLKQGILISVEGIDGSGKSTLAKTLSELCTQAGYQTLLTKEPGATPLGKELREIVQRHRIAVCKEAEYLMFAADRAQHFTDVIIPALSDKALVVSDRMADSSLVYQGYGRGLDKNLIAQVNQWAMKGLSPDLVFYVRVPLEVALERIARRAENRSVFETETGGFQQRLLEGFDALAHTNKKFILLDGTQSATHVAQHAFTYLHEWICTNKLLL